MEVCRRSSWLLLLLGVSLLAATLQGVQGEVESEGPSESECRPYIEKALKELETGESGTIGTPETGESKEDVPTVEVTNDDSDHHEGEGDDDKHEGTESIESVEADQNVPDEQQSEQEDIKEQSAEETEAEQNGEDKDTTQEDTAASQEQETVTSELSGEQKNEDTETEEDTEEGKQESLESVEEAQPESEDEVTKEDNTQEADDIQNETADTKEETDTQEETSRQEEADDTKEDTQSIEEVQAEAQVVEQDEATPDTQEEREDDKAESDQQESVEGETVSLEEQPTESVEETQETTEDEQPNTQETNEEQDDTKEQQDDTKSAEQDDTKSETTEDETVEKQEGSSTEAQTSGSTDEASTEQNESTLDDTKPEESQEDKAPKAPEGESAAESEKSVIEGESTQESDVSESKESETVSESAEREKSQSEEGESAPEEELSFDVEIPSDLRDRTHVEHLLKLDEEASESEKIINRVAEITLKELKKLYENAIKPLEVLYKYRDLSNRHFGDAEIFSKPLILFMGPWSGGKSSIINYLLDNEYNETSLRTGAEPSPAYFNILMYGEEPEILDGTQLAADFTFSGLQKFGQGLEERLRGVKLPSKLLDRVNIVEIPGILEVRKQVSRVFPFNDACQWFIDRADIIFLVYDPSKLDVGPETEAILDQLKGREHQTRIILNKADQVKPEELMRVQGALIWNISPLMSSAQPPIMYTTSLWSRPYESWAPARLLQAQERAFLRDLRTAVDKRIENKIASARRFAVRVRNHAKMVDCYLTTYYNHKSVFGNRKQVADEIIEHPQDYHIYEGLSTLTNISRYDLPDPDVYRDFFKLNPLYDFQQLSATCTYFRGCPINRLDVAIAYDLPEMVGKHKRLIESALAEANQTPVPGS